MSTLITTCFLLLFCLLASTCQASSGSATWQRVLWLEDYNTQVVVLGTSLLGMAAGLVGSFTLLRRRALMGDALSHATLPGIALTFILAAQVGWQEKSLFLLLFGATVSGLLGMGAILFIRNLTRLKEDTALGIVLSVFFGIGIAMLGIIQQMQTGSAAGLEDFIYGKTASMIARDAWLIGSAGIICLVVTFLLFKELTLLCFDEVFAGSRGYPVLTLDVLLMCLVVLVTIVGLQAVGLILMIALLVIPAAAARFWTERIGRMALVAGLLGALSGLVGSMVSALAPRLPSGAMIVLVAAGWFLVSLFFGPVRGIVPQAWRRYQFQGKILRQHLLRAMYEYLEVHQHSLSREQPSDPVPLQPLLHMRSWSQPQLLREVQRAQREGLVEMVTREEFRLTALGVQEAARLVHEHRLWEMYLIAYAEIAPSRVDQDADAIEHVLSRETIAELEALLEREQHIHGVPPSPHPLPVSFTEADASQSASSN